MPFKRISFEPDGTEGHAWKREDLTDQNAAVRMDPRRGLRSRATPTSGSDRTLDDEVLHVNRPDQERDEEGVMAYLKEVRERRCAYRERRAKGPHHVIHLPHDRSRRPAMGA